MKVNFVPTKIDKHIMATHSKHFFNIGPNTHKFIFIGCLAMCLMPVVSPPLALVLGLAIAQTIKNPFIHLNHKATNLLLKGSVIGLGFGMNMFAALKAGEEGILVTVVSITGVLTAGILLGKWMKIDRKISFLISAGTAICGGSAIAALSPVVKAEERQISVALATVFILNSVALFLFPAIGHYFDLSQTQFGLWCAVAIHDTSSVVGAASRYGAEALQIATTVKLVRALWIIPVAFGTAFVFKSDRSKIQFPYFIGLFVLALLSNTYFPFIQPFSSHIVAVSKIGLTITLFLIGTGLSFETIKSVGVKPLVEGLLLWGLISTLALIAVIKLI